MLNKVIHTWILRKLFSGPLATTLCITHAAKTVYAMKCTSKFGVHVSSVGLKGLLGKRQKLNKPLVIAG